jgi:DNA-binding beta-propeller fold protein YncE
MSDLKNPDLNNRPGGSNLIVTAKTAHKIHFLDAETLTPAKTIDMPGSTHELALSSDQRTAYGTVYGDGIFTKRINPDRRIVVIDLPSRALTRVIDLGETCAPHGIKIDASGAVWCSGELANSVFAIDPASAAIQRIEVGHPAHWLAISHSTGKVFVTVKTDFIVVIDVARRIVIDQIRVPNLTEGIAISPDGGTLYICAQTAPEFYVVDTRTHAIAQTVAIEAPESSANPTKPQMRRVHISPDNRYILVSAHQDARAAIYAVEGAKPVASFPTGKGPMGFGFAPDGKNAYLCCHDDAFVTEFELATGKSARIFQTAAGCEFVVAYG